MLQFLAFGSMLGTLLGGLSAVSIISRRYRDRRPENKEED